MFLPPSVWLPGPFPPGPNASKAEWQAYEQLVEERHRQIERDLRAIPWITGAAVAAVPLGALIAVLGLWLAPA